MLFFLAIEHIGPHLVQRLRRGRDEVLAVVEHAAVAGERGRVQLAVVGGRLDGRLEQPGRVEGELALERRQPALGGELRGPHHVDGDDVVAGVLGLHVLHDVVVLLVGVVGLLLERDLLVGVGRVPLLDGRRPDVAVVLARHEGDRALAAGVRLRGSATAAGRGAVAPAAGGRSQRHSDGGGEQDLCAASCDLSGHQAVSVSLWTCRRPSRLGTEGSAGPSKSAFAGPRKRNGLSHR